MIGKGDPMQTVKVHIHTNMKKQQQTLKQNLMGKLAKRDDGWVLVYKEVTEDGQEIATTMKISRGQALITRTGAIQMRQEYIVGEWTEGKYKSPYGMMWMKTKADVVSGTEQQIQLHYRLFLDNEDMGRYEVIIQLEPMKKTQEESFGG
jgi:uncharacterized beta-barrel protein YwiB (DUF1934 family)